MASNLSKQFILNQIGHWFLTPQNSYLGSNYGVDLYQYLHKPMTSQFADEIIAKMRADIPALKAVPDGELNIYSKNESFDTKIIYVEVSGLTLEFDLEKIDKRETREQPDLNILL